MPVNAAGALVEWIIAISLLVGPTLVLFAVGFALGKKRKNDNRLGYGCAGERSASHANRGDPAHVRLAGSLFQHVVESCIE